VNRFSKDIISTGIVSTVAAYAAVIVVLASSFCAQPAQAMYQGGHHSFLGGPWELVVKMGMDGEPLRFPLKVADENKVHKFEDVLPVMGTPIKIRVEQYLPNLGWQTTAVKHPGGGTIAKLNVSGKNLDQELWLSSANPLKQSVSSPVGSIGIIDIQNGKTAEKIVKDLTDSKTVGILTIWPEGSESPIEVAAKTGQTVKVKGSSYTLKVGEYVPHYSIDLETRKVVSISDKPVNPAIKITAYDGARTFEQWIWAKFPASPHESYKIPMRIRFTESDLKGEPSKRFVITAPESKRWLLYSRRGRKRVEKIALGKSYPFAEPGYSFSIENIVDGAIIKTDWTNKSDTLLHPAIIATVEQSGAGRQAVLELNKPIHHKTKYGTLVLLYRRNPAPVAAKD
jgi:hypothetical protein